MALKQRAGIALVALAVSISACRDLGLEPTLKSPNAGSTPSLLKEDGEIPSRAEDSPFSWERRSDADLWSYISQTDSTIVLGLKAPGAARGVWRADVLVNRGDQVQGRAAVLAQNGVMLVGTDPTLPVLRLKLTNLAVLSRIRGLPFVDYIEPATMRLDTGQRLSMFGCKIRRGMGSERR